MCGGFDIIRIVKNYFFMFSLVLTGRLLYNRLREISEDGTVFEVPKDRERARQGEEGSGG